MSIMAVDIIHSKTNRKKSDSGSSLILARAAIVFAVLGTAVLGISDQGFAGGWADSMGEGSGVDRGAMISDSTPGSGSSGSSTSALGTASSVEAMRASMENDMKENLAASFDYGEGIAAAFDGGGTFVPAVPAGNSEET